MQWSTEVLWWADRGRVGILAEKEGRTNRSKILSNRLVSSLVYCCYRLDDELMCRDLGWDGQMPKKSDRVEFQGPVKSEPGFNYLQERRTRN